MIEIIFVFYNYLTMLMYQFQLISLCHYKQTTQLVMFGKKSLNYGIYCSNDDIHKVVTFE
jgi:hypothetical protein